MSKLNWKDNLPSLVLAYNATKSSSTGYSPHFLMFGWHPRLSVDAFLETGSFNLQYSQLSYAARLQEQMRYAYRVAGEAARKRAGQNKTLYDRNVRENKLVVGDTVLVGNVNLQGRHKLAVSWERDPYKVVAIPYDDQPVFQVRLESGSGPVRTLHITSIPVEDDAPAPVTSVPVPRPRPRTRARTQIQKKAEDSESDTSTSSSSGFYVILQRRRQHFPSSPPAAAVRSFSRSTPVSHVSYTPVSASPSFHTHMYHYPVMSAHTPCSSIISHTLVPFSRPRLVTDI